MKFLKKLGFRLKLFFGFIVGILTFIAYFAVRKSMSAKDKLKYELAKNKSELEIAHLEEKTELNDKKIETLKEKEKVIREKISILEEKERKNEDISLEELDKFFDDRGF